MYIQWVTTKDGHVWGAEVKEKCDELAIAAFGADNIDGIEYQEIKEG